MIENNTQNTSLEQLLKKDCSSGEYNIIHPITTLDAITDIRTGESMEKLVDSYNHIYLPFTQNSRAITRCQIPKHLRRRGLWITYVSCKGIPTTEWYNGDNFSDIEWGKTENWMEYMNIELVKKLVDTIVDWYKA